MVIDRSKLKYVPGTYAKKRPDAAQIARLANILDVEETEAEKLLHQIDQEQHAFFKKGFGKKDASPYEFDLVLNSDFITEPERAADVIKCAFKEKFSAELKGEHLIDTVAT